MFGVAIENGVLGLLFFMQLLAVIVSVVSVILVGLVCQNTDDAREFL